MSPSALLEDVEDFVDVKGAIARLASLRTLSAAELLELYERSVDELAGLELEAAFALRMPGGRAVRSHADAARRIASRQASLGKALLRLRDESISAHRTAPSGSRPDAYTQPESPLIRAA